MRIEAPKSVNEFGFPIDTASRADLYKEMGSLIYKKLEESSLGTAFQEITGLPKRDVKLFRSGVVYHIVKAGGGYPYPLHTTVVTNPKDELHNILIFSKRPWKEIIWEELQSKIK